MMAAPVTLWNSGVTFDLHTAARGDKGTTRYLSIRLLPSK